MAEIAQSVGEGGVNRDADVRTVQSLLNAHATTLDIAPLAVDGKPGAALTAAIRRCQTRLLDFDAGDGLIDPGGRTLQALNGVESAPATAQLSGAAWWQANQARFPNSVDLSDLDASFRGKAAAFIDALRQAGAEVDVRSTRRHKIRAHLMHYSWKVAKGVIRATDVPAVPDCAIVWDHGSDARSRQGAQEMVDEIGVVFQPSLFSQHIPGLAVDLTITWSGAITVKDATGAAVTLSSPSDGSNPALHKLGASYGVIKLPTDPPHWSVDGH